MKPINVLSKTAMIAALASAAIVPAAATSAQAAEASTIADVIVTINGQEYSFTNAEYKDYLIEGMIAVSTVSHIKASNGKYYKLSDYKDYLIENNTIEATLAALDNTNKDVAVAPVKGEFDNNGNIIPPASNDFEVTDIASITKTGVTVNFPSLEKDVTGATVKVVNPAGNTVAVNAKNLAKGATSATFEFATALDSVVTGTWKVNGKDFVVAEGLKVESVTAINAKEVTVTFNKEVEKTSAEMATNYVIPGKTVTAKLQDDKKSVVLTVNTNLTLNTKTSVTINGVKTADGKEVISNVKTEFTPVDTTIPTVVDTKVVSPTKVRITFSEPLGNQTGQAYAVQTTDFTLNTTGVVVNTVEAVGSGTAAAGNAPVGYKVYDVNLNNPLSVGTHKLKVNALNAIKDTAGFIVPATEVELKVEADTVAPQVESATALSRSKVQVKFNKPVNESTLNGNRFFWNTTGNAANNANTGNAGTVADKTIEKVDDTTYNISFATNFLNTGKVYFFNSNNITDVTGNPFPTKAIELTVAEDAKPEVTSVKALSDKIFEVHFNKPMSNSAVDGALAKANYVFKDSNDKVVTLGTNFTNTGALGAGANITLNATGDVATIIFGTALPADTYSVTVDKAKDRVGVALPSPQKSTVSPVDTTPVAAGATLAGRAFSDATDVSFVVTFPEAMATTGNYSVLDKSKWVFNTNVTQGSVTAPATALSTLAGVTLSASPDGRQVTIKGPAASFVNNNFYSFGLSNFADKSGNIQTGLAHTPVAGSSVQIATAASTGASLQTNLVANSLKLTDAKTIEFKLNKGIQTLDPSEFIVAEGGTDYTTATTTKRINDVTYTNNTDGTSTVKVTMDKDLDLTANINVKTSNPAGNLNTIDVDGLPFAKNASTTVNAKVDISPAVKSVSLVSTTQVVVQFDQTMTIANAGDFVVTVGGEAKTVIAATASGNYVSLLLSAPVSSSATPVVKTVAQDLIQSESAAGKKIVAFEDGRTATNVRVQSVTLQNGEAGANSAAAAAGDKISFTFTEAIDAASLGFNPAAVSAGGDKQTDGTYSVADGSFKGTVIANAGGNSDSLSIAKAGRSIGTLLFMQNATGDAATAGGQAVDFNALLSADGKTLTLTINDVQGNTITNANFDYAIFSPYVSNIATAIKDVNGNVINTSFTASTSSKF